MSTTIIVGLYEDAKRSRDRYRKIGLIFEAALFTNHMAHLAGEFSLDIPMGDLELTPEEREEWEASQEDVAAWNAAIPDVIYLQFDEDGGDATWHVERINESDVEYRRTTVRRDG
jgi:hypothetical protein